MIGKPFTASASLAFPQNADLRIEIPADLMDDTGRILSNAASFPLQTRTAGLPPLAKFPGKFGILELKEGGLLPVTLHAMWKPT